MAFIDKYHKFLEKYKIAVLVFWVIILGLAVWLGPKFLGETSSNFDAPEDSPSVIADKIFAEDFPGYENETSMIIVIRMVNESESVINMDTVVFCSQFISSIQNSTFNQSVSSLLSYYILFDAGFSDAAESFVSDDERSMLIAIDFEYGHGEGDVDEFIRFLREEIQETLTAEDFEDFNVYLTGFLVMYLDMQEVTEEDLLKMDMIVIPIALLVLGFVLRSLKLMILPIAGIGISILSSFLVMYPLSLVWDIFSFVPSIMMSLVIAMSIDYSLFLLSRYREEIMKKKEVSEAVYQMSKHAGHTITVSGLTLAITFLGLVFFPVELLSTIGLGSAIAIVMTLIVNLTLTPALLLTFGGFFKKFTLYKKLAKKQPETEKEFKKRDIESQMKSIWYKIGKFSTKYAPFVIIIIVAAAIPISIQVFKFDRSMDFLQILPRGSDSDLAYQALAEDFSPGQILPFYLIVRTNQTNGIMNSTFFQNAIDMTIRLDSETGVTNDSFTSIVRAGGMWIPFPVAIGFLEPASPNYNTSLGMLYREIFTRYSNPDNSTVILEIQTPFDPWGDEAEDWIKETRSIMVDMEAQYGYELHLAEGSAFMIDVIDEVYRLFPLMIIITIIVVYILIAIMFKSVFIPLRLIFTIGITLSWIYGLGMLVFKTQLFKSFIPALQGVNAFYWLVPIMAFSILIGIGLDYDIFLLSRISEFRDMGFTEKASIHKGLYKTGNIISFAGIIMAIAFSGLMLSREMVLNQFGFMLCVAVLIDTFIIRTILVPAIMSLAEKWNWWPKKVPEPTKTDTDYE